MDARSVRTRAELTEVALSLVNTNPAAFVAALGHNDKEIIMTWIKKNFKNMTKIRLMYFVGKYEPDEMDALMKRLEKEDAKLAEEKKKYGG
jgi:hypothetical protein